jgi:membrane protease YdiL (CAAX protease family)
MLTTSLFLQLLYVVTSLSYIKLISKEQEMAPYLINELRSIRLQCQKGLSLGLSAFLLLTIYTIIILKLGKIILPKHLDFGEASRNFWPAFLIIGAINPILEEWYWRLFLPKVHGSAHLDYQADIYQRANHQHLLFAFPLYTI